jgi:plastocyanin
MPSFSNGLTRRAALRALVAGLAAPALVRATQAGRVVEIRLRSDPLGTKVWFDPIGILIAPGQTVRWVNEANVHTSTAYHPDNDGHALRIPTAAEPWDSDYLVEPGDQFEVTLTVPGVYDYFCTPHEMAGMVGRIIRQAKRARNVAVRLLPGRSGGAALARRAGIGTGGVPADRDGDE